MKFLIKKYEELGQKTTLSKQEKELDKILENYVFYNDKTSKNFFGYTSFRAYQRVSRN